MDTVDSAVSATLRIRPVFEVIPHLDSEQLAYQIDSPGHSLTIDHTCLRGSLCVLRSLCGPSDGTRRDEVYDGSLLLSLLQKSSRGRSPVCQPQKPLGNC